MRPEQAQGVLCHSWEQMKGRGVLKTPGKITQHVAFRSESSSCLPVVLLHLVTIPQGWTYPKGTGSLPAMLLPLHLSLHPPPELPAGFPLSSRVPGNQGQVPRNQPHVPASAEHCPGKQSTGLGVSHHWEG